MAKTEDDTKGDKMGKKEKGPCSVQEYICKVLTMLNIMMWCVDFVRDMNMLVRIINFVLIFQTL